MSKPKCRCGAWACLLAVAVTLLCAPGARSEPATDVAVVVHPRVKTDNLSLAELRKIMLGRQQYWSNGLRITLLVRAPQAREREVVLKRIYQMTETQFRQYWIAAV